MQLRDKYQLNAEDAKLFTIGTAHTDKIMTDKTFAQEKVDDVIVDVMSHIHEAVYSFKRTLTYKHPVFARIVEEPIEILVRRAEVICNLRELGFKCETTEKDIENGTLTISWN